VSTSDVAVIILAAGAGTRMKSKLQKTLHTIGGRSLLSHAVHAAAAINPQHIVTVIGHGKEQVEPAVAEIAQQLDTPVASRITAPISTMSVEVSPTEPGINPMKRS